jgi:hypothetical protein
LRRENFKPSKHFFFEKKKQKTSAHAGRGIAIATTPNNQKFLRAFFKKRCLLTSSL